MLWSSSSGRLQQVEAAVGAQKLRRAFSKKSKNRDQFNQLLAEIATSATCASRAKLLELEWRTGRGGCDADVRAEVKAEPVNLEVTLRTDSWLKEVAFHIEDYLDEQGNLIREMPRARSRRTMTELEWVDLSEAGVVLPKRVSDAITERKKKKPKTVFVGDPDDLPPEEKPKGYCADGDDPRVESNNVQRCVRDKAVKFNPDGMHFIVLPTMDRASPSERSAFDAVFGQARQIKHHGLFESGDYNQVCGVLYLPVFEQLDRLTGRAEIEPVARLFPNHNAQIKPSESLLNALAGVFEAEIRRGWDRCLSSSGQV